MSLNNSIVEIIENDNYSVVSNDSFDSKDSFDLNDKVSSDDNSANGSDKEFVGGSFRIISEGDLACFACNFKGVRNFSLSCECCLCSRCVSHENKTKYAANVFLRYECCICHYLGNAETLNGRIFCTRCISRNDRYEIGDTFEKLKCLENEILCDQGMCNSCFRNQFVQLSFKVKPIEISNGTYGSESTYANFIIQNENKILASANYQITQSFLKFERIARLVTNGDDILDRVEADLSSNNKSQCRNALILILAFTFGIRSGTTYKSNNAETGIFNLKKEHIMINRDNIVTLVYKRKRGVIINSSYKLDDKCIQALSNRILNLKNDDYIFLKYTDSSKNGKITTSFDRYLKDITNDPGVRYKDIKTWNTNNLLYFHLKKINNQEIPLSIVAYKLVILMRYLSVINDHDVGNSGCKVVVQNYIDPRYLIAFCKSKDLDPKVFLAESATESLFWGVNYIKDNVNSRFEKF